MVYIYLITSNKDSPNGKHCGFHFTVVPIKRLPMFDKASHYMSEEVNIGLLTRVLCECHCEVQCSSGHDYPDIFHGIKCIWETIIKVYCPANFC